LSKTDTNLTVYVLGGTKKCVLSYGNKPSTLPSQG